MLHVWSATRKLERTTRKWIKRWTEKRYCNNIVEELRFEDTAGNSEMMRPIDKAFVVNESGNLVVTPLLSSVLTAGTVTDHSNAISYLRIFVTSRWRFTVAVVDC